MDEPSQSRFLGLRSRPFPTPEPSLLTAFVAPLRQNMLEEARQLLGLEGAALSVLQGPVPLRLRVEWPKTLAFSVSLEETDAPARAAVHSGPLRLNLHPPEGDRQTFRALVARMVTAFSHRPRERFQRAFAAWRPYAQVEDRDYVRKGATTMGLAGQIRLGFRCNQDCGFCWQERRWPAAPEGMIEQWLTEMKGVPRLSFSGGEPTLDPRLPDWIRIATEGGSEVNLQTNALRLRSKDYRQRLIGAGLKSVLVSFHSSDAATSDQMTRAPGTWAFTVAGIRGCLEDGIAVALNCVVTAENLLGLPAHADFVAKHFLEPRAVEVVNYSHPSPSAVDSRPPLPLDAVAPPLSLAIRRLTEAKIPVHASGSCGFPPCIFREQGLDAPGSPRVLADGEDLEARVYGRACEGCVLREECPGLRREYLETMGERGIFPQRNLSPPDRS